MNASPTVKPASIPAAPNTRPADTAQANASNIPAAKAALMDPKLCSADRKGQATQMPPTTCKQMIAIKRSESGISTKKPKKTMPGIACRQNSNSKAAKNRLVASVTSLAYIWSASWRVSTSAIGPAAIREKQKS